MNSKSEESVQMLTVSDCKVSDYQRLTVNNKLFGIKRFFYLSTLVIIHFFKTFILPCFYYTLSLIIYFPQATFLSLKNCFNSCILGLFKFQLEINYSDEAIEK